MDWAAGFRKDAGAWQLGGTRPSRCPCYECRTLRVLRDGMGVEVRKFSMFKVSSKSSVAAGRHGCRAREHALWLHRWGAVGFQVLLATTVRWLEPRVSSGLSRRLVGFLHSKHGPQARVSAWLSSSAMSVKLKSSQGDVIEVEEEVASRAARAFFRARGRFRFCCVEVTARAARAFFRARGRFQFCCVEVAARAARTFFVRPVGFSFVALHEWRPFLQL